jgi:hypothetical protein
MLKTIDDEFARYLTSYLVQNRYKFVKDDKGRLVIEEDELYELIKEFRQELP